MKKSEWLDCQGNEFFPKQKGTPSLVKIEHKNTATLDSVRSKKKSKVAVLQLVFWLLLVSSNYFTKFHDFPMIIHYFQFHNFSMHRTFLLIFHIACGNPVC